MNQPTKTLYMIFAAFLPMSFFGKSQNTGLQLMTKEAITRCSRRRGINRFSFSVFALVPRAPEPGRHAIKMKIYSQARKT